MQRDESGRFLPEPGRPTVKHEALVLAAMLVSVELLIIGSCTIFSVTMGAGLEMGDAGRAIFGGILAGSGLLLGVLGFMRT